MANKKITDLPQGTRARTGDLFESSQTPGTLPTSNKLQLELIAPSADNPPTTANAMDDEFDSSATLPGGGSAIWSWVNQGAASFVLGASRCVLIAPAATGDNLKMLEQAAPANPWEFTARICPEYGGIPTNGLVGIYARQSSTGKIVIAGWQATGGGAVTGFYFNSPTSFNTTFGAVAFPATPYYVRLKDDGTNFIFSYSRDGVLFNVFQTLGRTAFLTGSADGVGICASSEQNVNLLAISADWFRRTV